MRRNTNGRQMAVSIIIKALNEADRIESAVRHALAAVAPLGGEVVLADSGSTDATIEIASRFPIRIVRLENACERSCGLGPQLGYLHTDTSNPYVAITDGDMELDRDFPAKAIAFLEANPDYAGVSGQLVEMSLDQLEYQRRDARKPSDMKAGDVDRLNGGGIFRRSAVAEAGYLTDRNLHSYEEYDLALRLREKGYKLHRLADTFVTHYGHRTNPYALLWRRLKSKYLFGIGELTRAHLGTPRFATLLADVREVKLWSAVALSWLIALLGFMAMPGAIAGIGFTLIVLLAPIPLMIAKYRSVPMGLYSGLAWHPYAYGFLRGLMASRRDPRAPISAQVVHEPQAVAAAPSALRAPAPSSPTAA